MTESAGVAIADWSAHPHPPGAGQKRLQAGLYETGLPVVTVSALGQAQALGHPHGRGSVVAGVCGRSCSLRPSEPAPAGIHPGARVDTKRYSASRGTKA
jgi:hypothetical protein